MPPITPLAVSIGVPPAAPPQRHRQSCLAPLSATLLAMTQLADTACIFLCCSASRMQSAIAAPLSPCGLQADGDDASFCCRDRGAATGHHAPSAGSLLDLLWTRALAEAPAVQAGPSGTVQHLPPACPPAAQPGSTAPVAHPVCPGAPRRVGRLPPPPEVPADVLAALRPLRQPARRLAAPCAAGSGSAGSCSFNCDPATSQAGQLAL